MIGKTSPGRAHAIQPEPTQNVCAECRDKTLCLVDQACQCRCQGKTKPAGPIKPASAQGGNGQWKSP